MRAIFLIMISGSLLSCNRQRSGQNFPRDFQGVYLDMHHLEDYRVGKNSFVLGLETFCNRPAALPENGRKTILDLQGTGSLRHIWETHGPGKSPFILEFYVDGEAKPSIRGPLDELVEAARHCKQTFVPQGGTLVDHDSYNFYLPVPFETSLKIDLVAKPEIGMVFLQLDYRLEDPSMKGMRLVQKEDQDGGKIRLAYHPGHSVQHKEASAWPRTKTRTWRFVGDQTIKLEGPAIIRRLAVNARREGIKLIIRFDGEDYFSFAFFGKGENFPYSEAFDNHAGRMRVHLEKLDAAVPHLQNT